MIRVGILGLDKNSRLEEMVSRSVNGGSHLSAERIEPSKQLLADPKYDAIAVVGSNLKKTQYAKEALLSGKHVLIDFPAGHKLEEIHQLYDIATEKQLCLFSPNLMKTELGLSELRQTANSGTSRLLSLTITYAVPVPQGAKQFLAKLMQLLDLAEWLTNSRQTEMLSHVAMAGKSPQACIALLSMENGVKALVNLYSISSSSKESFWVDGVFEDLVIRANPYVQSLKLSHSDHSPDQHIECGQSSLDFALADFFIQISQKEILDIEHTKRMFELAGRVVKDS
jgi:hypothetical protein